MTGGTTIIREAPRVKRSARLSAAGFVLPAPTFRALTLPVIDELRVALRLYPALIAGFVVTGALLWPITVITFAYITPPTIVFMRAQQAPPLAQVTVWYATASSIAGLATGVLQQVLLRQVASGVRWWAPFTTIGWAVGVTASLRLALTVSVWLRTLLYDGRFGFWSPPWERSVALVVTGLALGLLVGVAQWVALRGIRAPLGARTTWIAASILAWTIGMASVQLMPRVPDFLQQAGRFSGAMESLLPGLTLAGAFYGFLTSFVMVLLLRRAAPRPVET